MDMPAKIRRGRPILRWKDACKRDMTKAGLKEGNITNSAEWRKKIISYTPIPEIPDDGTSQGVNASASISINIYINMYIIMIV